MEIITSLIASISTLIGKKKERKIRKYKTQESLSPVALQMNVTQTGILLKGLQMQFDSSAMLLVFVRYLFLDLVGEEDR